MRPRSPDTDPEAERVQIALLREASVARRCAMALSLSGAVIGMARRAIRRALPEASEAELGVRYAALHYGKELAEGLRQRLDSERR